MRLTTAFLRWIRHIQGENTVSYEDEINVLNILVVIINQLHIKAVSVYHEYNPETNMVPIFK